MGSDNIIISQPPTGGVIEQPDYGKIIADEAVRLAFGLAKTTGGAEIVSPSAVRNPAGQVNWGYSQITTGASGAPVLPDPKWQISGKNATKPAEDLYTYTRPGSVVFNDTTQGDKVMAELELPQYYQAKSDALAVANATPGRVTRKPTLARSKYANCSGFTSSVIIRIADPHFPGELVDNQVPYLTAARDQGVWKLIGYTRNDTDNTTKEYDPSKYQPGDLFITHRHGHTHTFLWIGAYRGFSDIIAEASNAPQQDPALMIPRLHRIQENIRDKGVDRKGRPYSVWRYMGGTYVPTGQELVPRTSTGQIFSNSRAVLRGPVASGHLDHDSLVDVTIDMIVPSGIRNGQKVFLTTESPFMLSVVGDGRVRLNNALIATLSVIEEGKVLEVAFNADGPKGLVALQITAGFEDGYTGSADEQRFTLGNIDDATDFSAPITYTIG